MYLQPHLPIRQNTPYCCVISFPFSYVFCSHPSTKLNLIYCYIFQYPYLCLVVLTEFCNKCYTTWKRVLSTVWTGRWLGLRFGLDMRKEKYPKASFRVWIQITQPIARNFTDGIKLFITVFQDKYPLYRWNEKCLLKPWDMVPHTQTVKEAVWTHVWNDYLSQLWAF